MKMTTAGVTIGSAFTFAILLIAHFNGCTTAQKTGPGTTIVGGIEATPYEFPWIVDIRRDPGNSSRHSCGGSIISREWIVTAGHCAQSVASSYEIVAGDHNLTLEEGTEQRSLVSKIIVHENYDDYYLENDIALMKVDPPFVFNDKVQPAPLPAPGFEPKGVLVVSGWGRLSFQGPLPDVLMKVDVPLISLNVCRQVYPGDEYPLFDHNICAGYLDGQMDSCNGDSGGPLMCRASDNNNATSLTLCGLVSWGGTGEGSCAAPNEPGVYAAVAPFYYWVMEKLRLDM